MKIKFVKQDQWIGHYYDNNYHYVCLIPCVVFMWRKKVTKRVPHFLEICYECKEEIPRGSGSFGDGVMYCSWCSAIRNRSCLHLETVQCAPIGYRPRIMCVKCRARQVLGKEIG